MTTIATDTAAYSVDTYDEAREFIAGQFPTARHEGMGYWRIPRTAHIFYGNPAGSAPNVTVEMMHGHTLADVGL